MAPRNETSDNCQIMRKDEYFQKKYIVSTIPEITIGSHVYRIDVMNNKFASHKVELKHGPMFTILFTGSEIACKKFIQAKFVEAKAFGLIK